MKLESIHRVQTSTNAVRHRKPILQKISQTFIGNSFSSYLAYALSLSDGKMEKLILDPDSQNLAECALYEGLSSQNFMKIHPQFFEYR